MSKFCPFCGEELVDEAKFCKSCGKNIKSFKKTQEDGQNHQYTPPLLENDHNLAYVAGIVCAIFLPLIGAIIGIYLYTRKDSSKARRRAITVIGLSVFVWIASSVLSLIFMGY